MEILKSKSTARVIAIALLITMMAWLLPTNLPEASAASYPKAPRTASDGTVTWDCVWFGHYPQSSNGKGGFNKDPIKWRVLSVKGDDAFLVADKNLDAKAYNEEYTDITWERSTLRSWLNGYGSSANKDGISYTSDSFKNKAFTGGEQSAIYEQTITNADNPDYGTPGGNNTKDKVFLLSIAEAKTSAYGFPGNYGETKTREVKNTAYAIDRGAFSYMGNGWWRLRSPGSSSNHAAFVISNGTFDSYGRYVNYSNSGIRPALHLNLSSNLWKQAGTVSSDGGSNESGGGEPVAPPKPVDPPEYKPIDKVDFNTPGTNGSVKLFEDAGGSAGNQPITKVFPGDYNLKFPLVNTNIEKENLKDGTYKLKMAIGVNKNIAFGSDNAWDKLKSDFETAKKNLGKNDRMNFLMKNLSVSNSNYTLTDKFKAKPDLKVAGYYEAICDEKGNIISDKGGAFINSSWNASATTQWLVGPVPLYVELGGGLSAGGQLGLSRTSKSSNFALSGSFKLTPAIHAGLGVGVSGAATAGVEGSGDLAIQLVPSNKGDLTAGLAAKVKVVFVFDWEHQIASKTYPLWNTAKKDTAKSISNTAQALSDSDKSFHLADRSYQDKTTAWNGSAKLKRSTAQTAADITQTELQSYILPDTIPQMETLGGDTIMVFQSNDKNRKATANSVKLMYSVYNGKTWSTPKALWDNGTLDAMSDIKVINGTLYAVWQKCKREITGTDTETQMKQAAKASEICLAKYNPSTKTFETAQHITNNDTLDMMPVLTDQSGRPSVIWAQNNTDDLTGMKGTKSIQAVQWNGSSWSAPRTLGTTTEYISELDGIYQSGNLMAAYISTDGKEQPSLYTVAGGTTRKVADSGNEPISGLNSDSNKIRYQQSGILKEYAPSSQSTVSIEAGEASAISANAQMFTVNGKTAAIWLTNTKDGCYLYSSVKTGDKYSEPVVLYENKNIIGSYFTATLDKDGNWDIALNAADKAKPNKTSLLYIHKENTPKVELGGILVNESEMEKKVQPISYSVTNHSEKTVSSIQLTVKLKDKVLLNKEVSCSIKPGETVYLEDRVDLTGAGTTADLKIQAVTKGQIDKTNTTLTEKVSLSDFAIEVEKQVFADAVKYTAKVTNQGQVAAGGTVALYGDAEGRNKIVSKKFTSIGPGKTTEVVLDYPISKMIFGGDKSAYCMVRMASGTTESNLENNVYYGVNYLWELSQDKKHIANYKISGATGKYTYTGKAIKPKVSIKGLKAGTHYTAAYSKNVHAGTASIIVTGKKPYHGKMEKTFTIKKAKQTISAKSYKKTYGSKPFALNAKAKGKLTYKSSNSKVATVSKTGKITLKGKGKATITLNAAATKDYAAATKKISITVIAK